jgi:hypothetical protein
MTESGLIRIITRHDFKIVIRIDGTNWTEIKKFIKARHKLIHNANNQTIIDEYPKEKIQQTIEDMSVLISKVDENLFTKSDRSLFSSA